MPIPNFTTEEQYLVSVMRGDVKSDGTLVWFYLLTGATIAGFAAIYGNTWMMLSAFIVVCGIRIYEEVWQAKWKPVFRSVILKYDEAIAGTPEKSN